MAGGVRIPDGPRRRSRTLPAAIFYNDFFALLRPPPFPAAHAAYEVTNTDGVNYADVWATIGNFHRGEQSGPVVTLATNAASAIDLGPLANGQTKTAFFYLGSNDDHHGQSDSYGERVQRSSDHRALL